MICLLPFSYGGISINNSVLNNRVPEVITEENNTSLHLENGIYFLNNLLFSGSIVSYYGNGALNEKSGFIDGKKEGVSGTWFDNGVLQTKRFYVNGEKDGTHYGWYDDGAKRFEYNFKNGVNTGVSTEWYQTGAIARKTVYSNGKEESVQAWRDNGKLYINYVVKDGVIYGMNNSHLCYTLKNEKGEYYVKK